jgi:hypothetical protein
MQLSLKCLKVVRSDLPKWSRAAQTLCVVGLLALSLILMLGCKKNEKSLSDLSDLLVEANKRRAVVIEQIALNIREGAPKSQSVRNARVIKRVDQQEQIEKFASVLSKATAGRRFVNHPISIGNCVLRININGQPYFFYCELLESKDGKYCVFNVGGMNQININRMPEFESKTMVEWLRDNGIEMK